MKASIAGFCDFCKNNIPLIIAVSIMLFFAYGIRLFWYSIGIDTESWMADKAHFFLTHIKTGRFGLTLLSYFLYIEGLNPFTAQFTAFCLIWFSTVSWCYIIAIFSSRNTGRNNKLIPFALVFITMPTWAEAYHFILMAPAYLFITSLCPYVIYLFYKGFLENEKGKIACAFILLVFMTSVYQAIVPMFCCGVFICFLLLQEHSDYEPMVYRNLCLKLLITLIGAMAVYIIIDRIIIPDVFHIEHNDYVDNMNQWGKIPIKENILRILGFGYSIALKNIPLIESFVDPIIAPYMSEHLAMRMDTISRIGGNALLLPISMFFLAQLAIIMRKIIPAKRRFLHMLAGAGIPLSIMFLSIAGGTATPIRSLWALPLAMAFMLFFLIAHYKKKAAAVVIFLALLIAAHNAQITAQLFYSDYVRYSEDVRLAYDLDRHISQIQPDGGKLPVALLGKYEAASRFHANFLQGEVNGHSFFEWHDGIYSERGLDFMKSLGINYDEPSEEQLEQAILEAAQMPAYPNPDCTKRTQDFIVVKISEFYE